MGDTGIRGDSRPALGDPRGTTLRDSWMGDKGGSNRPAALGDPRGGGDIWMRYAMFVIQKKDRPSFHKRRQNCIRRIVLDAFTPPFHTYVHTVDPLLGA